VRFNIDGDERGSVSLSAEGVVIAAAVVAFRDTSPLLAPLLVAMAAAFWRVPRTRHQWFAIPGNLGTYGLPALAAAAALGITPLGDTPSALTLALVALPIATSYVLVNGALVGAYVVLYQRVPLRAVVGSLRSQAVGMYVPFLFGAYVGELSRRFGLVVFVLAAVVFVMVQAAFDSYRRLLDSERETCNGLIAAVERKDPYTAGHSKRVARYARYMGTQLGLKGRALARVEQHALMHDIGKLAVPNHVLRKPGKFTPEERELMRRHEHAGAAILSRIPFLALSAGIAAGHGHKDGFDGPAGDAHVVHAADAFDAMTSTRAYRKAHTQSEALAEMRTKAGKDFHPACVEALARELAARGETYGAGHEEQIVEYDTPPPAAALGETLDDQEAAEAAARAAARVDRALPAAARRPAPPLPPRAAPSVARDLVVAAGFGALAAAAATLPRAGAVAVPIALGALVAAGELVVLRPLHRAARPLSIVVMLVALASPVSLLAATLTIAAGLAAAAIARTEASGPRDRGSWFASRAAATAVLIAVYAAIERAGSGRAAVMLTALAVACAAGLVVQDLVEGRRPGLHPSVADVGLVACGPLAALGTAAMGLGALAILALPFGLLARGLDRTQRAHDNLFAWIRAAASAPEHAGLVVPGRAERVAAYALGLARRVGLDDELRDQLTAAAFMERVGECCLDEDGATGTPKRADEIVEESAAILKSTDAFVPAGRVLGASLHDPQLAPADPIDRAAQILRVAIAFEDATGGDVRRAAVPELIARLRAGRERALDPQLCDLLQQVVAPGTHRWYWSPVCAHAELACGCVAAVDEFSAAGDRATCPLHGSQVVTRLAVDGVLAASGDSERLAASVAGLIVRAPPFEGRGILRELFVRLASNVDVDVLAAIARAGYRTGDAWEHSIAHWMREGGADREQTADVLARAGTTKWDAARAVAGTYGRQLTLARAG
jgi:HD-GYP domain-containing protein (c-di-GMP phosphodiesterase class II)